MELWQAMAALGQHRHPDYWKPARDDTEGGSGDGRTSGRHRSGGAKVRSGSDLIDASQDLFAARRAAARGEGPKPAPAPNNDPGIGRVVSYLT